MADNTNTTTESPEVSAVSAVDAIIDAWHRNHFAGSATTEQWNHSVAAKEELKKLLANI